MGVANGYIYCELELAGTFSVPGAKLWTVYPFDVSGTPDWIISSSQTGPSAARLHSSQEPRAGNHCRSLTSGVQRLDRCRPYSGECDWDVLLNTNDLFSPPLPFSPWRAARTR